jgi:site-specific recombinase XerC
MRRRFSTGRLMERVVEGSELRSITLGHPLVDSYLEFVASGKGGRERTVPVSGRFFEALGEYLGSERPPEALSDACFVVLKGRLPGRRNVGNR